MRILWLNTEPLHPLDKGGKIRTYQMLKRIKREHEVTYVSFAGADNHETSERWSEYCHRLVTVPRRERPKTGLHFYRDLILNLVSSLPYAIQKYRSSALRRTIERELRLGDFEIVICDFLASSINLPPALSRPSVLFQHNVESTIWRRHYETQTHSFKREFFRSQWRRMLKYEKAACAEFDAVVAVSKVDRNLMLQEFGLSDVYEVPTGVDTDFFRPRSSAARASELVFTGSMDWMPNEDAILYFTREILPRIELAVPDVTLRIVGRNPSKRLAALAASNSRIIITGRVEDVRTHINQAAASIVPIRIGGGTRLKIFEAMAMEKPVISTSIGAEGLPVRDGEELLLADTPEDFAASVIGVLTDAHLAKTLGQQARKSVCERFGWESAAVRFMEVCENVLGNNARRRAA
jgi:sugar transferase (PEP-CTERM/EpsH1 system associated)